MVAPSPDVSTVRHDRRVTLSGRTLSKLAKPFEGGMGPSHSTIDRIWTGEDAAEYLGEGNKAEKVMTGLKTLRDGGRPAAGRPVLPPDHDKLHRVAGELAEMLLEQGLIDADDADEALSPGPPGTPKRAPNPGSSPALPHPLPPRRCRPPRHRSTRAK